MLKEMKSVKLKKNIYTMIFLTFLLGTVNINAQGIGEIAPPKPLENFPPNSWGVDIMFGDAGFGLGTFYRKQIDVTWSLFSDLSFSETKDEREFEYIDYWGNIITVGKKNRVFQIPINFGAHYRIFENTISDNLRPFIVAAAGPTILITTPYELEFFNSFGKAKAKFAAGGYVGLGADFGLDKKSLVGITAKYYYTKVINGGVESLAGKMRSEIQGFFITLNLGLMF